MNNKQPLPGSFNNPTRLAFIEALEKNAALRTTVTSEVARALGTTAGITNWSKYPALEA